MHDTLLVLTAGSLLVYENLGKGDRPTRVVSLGSFRCLAFARLDANAHPMSVVVVAQGGQLLVVDLSSKTS